MRCLCAGESRAKICVPSAASTSLLIAHLFDVPAEENFSAVEAQFAADLAGNELAVASQHLDAHAVVSQRVDRPARRVFRWIEKGDIAFENQVAFVIRVNEWIVAGDVLVGDREHAEAVGAQFPILLNQVPDEDGFHRENLAIQLDCRAPQKGRERICRDCRK